MITGDTIGKALYLQTLSGRSLTYASKAAFTADGWDIVWKDTSGTNLSSQPTYTVTSQGGGRHTIAYTVPSGIWLAFVTVPAWASDPGVWGAEGTANDIDTVAGILSTSQGVPGVQSASDSDLGDVVMGDSWNSGTLTIPLGKISAFGYSDLTGMTLTAAFKQDPTTTAVAATATILDASARTITVSWITFPAAMNLAGTATDERQVWYADAQLKHTVSGRIITGYRFQLAVVWQRDVTA